jgi:hypothetical protein
VIEVISEEIISENLTKVIENKSMQRFDEVL